MMKEIGEKKDIFTTVPDFAYAPAADSKDFGLNPGIPIFLKVAKNRHRRKGMRVPIDPEIYLDVREALLLTKVSA
ncbi:hypothetical protein C5167_001760 [Papaver somniferum]|uniref:Uncharacterized protein n=1 Tax=Papaver somniferum TaxID=3469 RepID=A0A4Y7L065_PAPSO|nr:hypothetical protein C5167_001760 [Papaver somniferum]